jgi:MOSC domain-containing protein YiiM
MRLHSIQIGSIRPFGVPGSEDPIDQMFESAIGKEPVAGRIWVGSLGLAGDTVADRRHHGGVDQAVLAYGAEHYPKWRREWQQDVRGGAFGENLTVEGADEDTTCLGDQWRAGEVLFEVTKPRTPCMTLARRHRRADLIKTVFENGRSGWYLRVLSEGWIEGGQSVDLVDRPFPQWPVRRVADVMRERQDREEEAQLLAACPALAEDWRVRLLKD